MRLRLLLLVGAAALLAGCLSGPGGCLSPRAPSEVPAGAPSEAGFGPDRVQVHVTDAQGRPLAGAAVTVVWNRDYIKPPEDEGDTVPDAPPLEYVDLRTDAQGEADAFLPSDRYFIVSAQADGHTEEWTSLLSPGSSPTSLTLRLYPSTLAMTASGNVASGVRHPSVDNVQGKPAWEPVQLAWPDLDAAQGTEGSFFWMGDRLVRIDAWMAWTTDQAEVASIEFRAGESGSYADAWAYEDLGLPAQQHNLSVAIPIEEDEFGFRPRYDGGVWAGPAITGPYVSTDGVPFTVGVVGTLDHRAVARASCGVIFADSELSPAQPPPAPEGHDAPAPPWVLVAVGLLALAAIARRRA